jgi:anion-transporting  ArsA/GET3 family ATPase
VLQVIEPLTQPDFDIPAMIDQAKVIVCCGAGGVGKTTSAAALGILAAQAGRSVCVMTIDPARRLAQAMGLAELNDVPQPIAVPQGRLSAMMLDPKHTFDRMVDTYAPSQRVRDSIFANRYYQELSSTLGGSRELIAMERVLEIAGSQEFDLLIVDTPPAQHALDFLDGPQRLIDMLDGSFTRMLVAPYGFAARAQFNLFQQSSAAMMKFLERLTGVGMLADLSEFLLAFSSMFEGLKERSHRVMSLMNEATTNFVLVCAPAPTSLKQVERFATRLGEGNLHIGGVLVNRVHESFGTQELRAEDIRLLDTLSRQQIASQSLSERVDAALQDARALSAADTTALQLLDELDQPRWYVPHFNRDLHSLDDLGQFASKLVASGSVGLRG